MGILKYRFILSLLLLFCSWQVEAKGKAEHIYDMMRVYSFLPQNSQIVSKFFNAVNASIDYKDFNANNFSGRPGNPDFLKESPFENTVWANHRVWFHWGYNTDARRYAPLTEYVNRNIEQGLMLEEHRSLFYSRLYKEVSRRNKVLQDIAATLLGYHSQDKGWSRAMQTQINAFISIPYAVHLLGDRTTTEVAVVLPMNDIVSSVFTAIRNLAGNVDGNITKANAVINKLKRAQDNPVTFLDAMQLYLPDYIMSLEGGIYDIKSKVKRLKTLSNQ